MTIDESVNIIVSQMLGGVMLHAQLSHFFNFLGLKGYAECQKYRYYEESSSYMDLNDYYICHYNKFVSDDRVENQNIIPADWYNFTRFDVNEGIRMEDLYKDNEITGVGKYNMYDNYKVDLYVRNYNEIDEKCVIKFLDDFEKDKKYLEPAYKAS
jgi:hypothetical protein